MSNSSQATAEEYYLTTEINDIKRYLRELGETQRTKIKKWAENLERLYEIGKSTVPVNRICAHIKQQASDELHWSQGQCDYVKDCLDKRFKDESFTRNPDGSNQYEQSGEPLYTNAVPLEQLKNLDDETLRAFIKKSRADLDHALFVATDTGVAIVGEPDRDPTIETELPQELETDDYYATLDLAQQLTDFRDNVLKLAEKKKQFPITDKELNRKRALQTRTFAQFFYGLNQRIMPSLTDEKFAFSEFEWYNTVVKEANYSKHGAAVKSKVEAYTIKDGVPVSTGKYRVLTREVVTDNLEEVVNDIQNATSAMDIFGWLNGWVQWRDIEGKMTQLTANRRIKLNPKLSSTAFGADTGKGFSDE